jgi:hypothetical protein
MMLLDDAPALQILRARDGAIEVCWEALTHLRCSEKSAAILATRGPLATGAWHHVAVSRTDATLALFLDGQLQSQRSGVTLPLKQGVMSLGARAGRADFLAGSLDEIEWYIRSLTPEDVTSLYRAAR